MNWIGLPILGFLKPRTRPRFGWPEALVLAIFCGLLLWVIPHHESWFDEAQAWLIARDSSLYDMLVHRLHYDGQPALWYLLLWVESRLGVSFLGMHYIAGLIAAGGIYVWLRYSPLPPLLTLLMPFTYFLQYEYAVVAREYVLCPLFAFTLMALMQNRKSRPMLFCVVAGLMANCSAHMFAFAVGLVLWYWWDRNKARELSTAHLRRQFAVPLAVFLLFLGTAAVMTWPTSDGNVGGGLADLIRGTFHGSSRTLPNGSVRAPAKSTNHGSSGELANGYEDNHARQITGIRGSGTMEERLASELAIKWDAAHTAILVPISTSDSVALVFLLLLGLNLWRERTWISALPYALILAVYLMVYGVAHHTGMLWVAILCILWGLSCLPARTGSWRSLRTALYALTAVIAVLQIGWSMHCLYGDVRGPFSGAPATAQFLRTIPANKRIAGFDDRSDAVNAYLPHFRYVNQLHSFWLYSKTKNPDTFIGQTMATHPDYVVVQTYRSGARVRPALAGLLQRYGYTETRRFCGNHYFRDSSGFMDCLVIYQPDPVPSSSVAPHR